jgi:hypothetical protein
MIIVMLLLATLAIFAFRGIFSSVLTAYEVDVQVSDTELRIDKNLLDNAHKAVFEKEVVKLDIVE